MTVPDDVLVPCACCREDRSVTFIGSVGLCQRCGPSEDELEDWDRRVALVDSLTSGSAPPCPHHAG
jgi:hypothetical protein